MDAVLYSILQAGFLFTLLLFLGDYFWASRKYRGKSSDHFDGKHFYNLGWSKRQSLKLERKNDGKGGKLIAFAKWVIKRRKNPWEKRSITPFVPKEHITRGVQITFVGHATLLIQIDGKNILTDPVWSERTSPIRWLGPKRYMDPGIDFAKLPHIDAVLISHNHYDHMDIVTLQKLTETHSMPIYTGLGNKKYLKERGIENVEELDWWQNSSLGDVKFHFVPAQHFSARGVTDRNKTLWGGFIIEGGEKTVYFAGDTGYGEFIGEIREHFSKGLDIGLIPMGAYTPSWFMAPIHTNPEEALKIQKELSIKTAIGIHYGTFPLAGDGQDDPLDDLREAQKEDDYKNLDFRTGPNGTSWYIT